MWPSMALYVCHCARPYGNNCKLNRKKVDVDSVGVGGAGMTLLTGLRTSKSPECPWISKLKLTSKGGYLYPYMPVLQ